jgi:NAD(P)-dependent dehydrogenase (short-subunit alcohol dehydrogenase family)
LITGMMIVKSVNDLSLDDFHRIAAVNVKDLFVATQEPVRHMGEGGRIINLGSMNSDHSELDYRSGYSCRWEPECRESVSQIGPLPGHG